MLMSEKKQVLYDLRVSYNGPLIIEDFYAEADSWIREKGFEKEPKKKMEHITKNGKQIEWLIEAQKQLDDLHQGIIIIRVLFDNVIEVVIKKNGKKMRINNCDALININGFVFSEIHGSFWQAKPAYYFMRALIDKYIYNFWADKYDGAIKADCHDLFKRIRSFFNIQKYKYQ